MRTPLERVRNLGILAHVDAGKTTITERILFHTGAIHRQGEVHDGTTVTDFDAQERDRGITIFAAAVTVGWRGHVLNLIDTPGHVDFADEVERSLRVIDGAVVVIDAVAGVQPQTEAVWRQADRYGVSRIVVVNKLDRPGADLDAAVASVEKRLGVTALVVQVPIGQEDRFEGVVDLVTMTALTWDDQLRTGPVPAELLGKAQERRAELEEAVAELHVGALDEYLTTGALAPDTLRAALRDLVRDGRAVVVLAASAYRNRGMEPLLDAIADYLPSPLDVPAVTGTWQGRPERRSADAAQPFAALVFKVVARPTGRLSYLRIYSGTLVKGMTVLNATTRTAERVARILRVQADRLTEIDQATAGDIVAVAGLKAARAGATVCAPDAPLVLEPPQVTTPVVSVAVETARTADAGALLTALARLTEEDPSLVVRADRETGQTVLSGLGELHLEVAVEKLRQSQGLAVVVGRPQVAYRETVVRGVTGFVHRHAKQDGGLGQFAQIVFDVEPLVHTGTPGSELFQDIGGTEFESVIVGGRVPKEFVRAALVGFQDALAEGPIGGHPVIGLRVRLVDGATHVKDSSELAFRTAGRLGLRAALRACTAALLEPVADAEVTVPDDAVGAVMGDLAARRGRLEGSAGAGRTVVVSARVPVAELFGYATRLRSRTQGRGTFTARPVGYAPATGLTIG